MKKTVRRFINGRVLPPILFLLILFLGLSLRKKTKTVREEKLFRENQAIGVLWHRHLFYVPFYYRHIKNFYIMVSPSADGQILDAILKMLGYKTVRGSTHENPRGSLLSMARKIKKGSWGGIVADGSRGPAQKSQMGAVYLAKMTGVPIYPLAFAVEKKINLNSWDKTIIPLPFSKVEVITGKPIAVDRKASEDELKKKNQEIEDELNKIGKLAESRI